MRESKSKWLGLTKAVQEVIRQEAKLSPGDRWLEATRSVITMRKLLKYYDVLRDRRCKPVDRFYALVQLSIYFKHDEDKNVVVKLMAIRGRLEELTYAERVGLEMKVAGEKLFTWLTPSRLGHHSSKFTLLLVLVTCCSFLYMCADYRNYQSLEPGPGGLKSIRSVKFDKQFLISWGGLYGPKIRDGQFYRWVSPILVHASLIHILSNLLLFITISWTLERKYGTRRIVVIGVLAGFGGNLFSATFENPCTVNVGASGLIFGIFGLWIADLIIDFHQIEQVLLRIFLVTTFLAFFVIVSVTQKNVSNFAHLGGFVSGLLPSLAILPRFGFTSLEATIPIAGVIMTMVIFAVLPTVLYLKRLKTIDCV